MGPPRSDYVSYLLQLWRVEQAESSVWRAALVDTRSRQRRLFATLDALAAFLRQETARLEALKPPPAADPDAEGASDES